jgi:hypothetical protein
MIVFIATSSTWLRARDGVSWLRALWPEEIIACALIECTHHHVDLVDAQCQERILWVQPRHPADIAQDRGGLRHLVSGHTEHRHGPRGRARFFRRPLGIRDALVLVVGAREMKSEAARLGSAPRPSKVGQAHIHG